MMLIDRKMIEKSKKYPFDIPNYSYVFVNGGVLKLIEFNPNSLMDCTIQVDNERQKLRSYLYLKKVDLDLNFSDCHLVLAYGSNASFKQLQRKFSSFNGDVMIPVIKACLFDFDIVYSAHFSPYGSIPATLQYSPETMVETFTIYLTDSQLNYMHETEKLGVNYTFGKLSDIRLVLENGMILHEAFSYLSPSIREF